MFFQEFFMIHLYTPSGSVVPAVDLACQLIRYPSITPNEAGCLSDLHAAVQATGAHSELVVFEDTTNLYVRWGQGYPHLCFAGHVDVVPPGDVTQWLFDPFQPTTYQGKLYGRGVADMKGAIACFLSAWLTVKAEGILVGSCSLLLTSDEEGTGVNGIMRMIPWLEERKEIPNVFLIGEPTGTKVGDVVQIGRRGSLTGHLCVQGTQGHIAYPQLADNPIPRLINTVRSLMDLPLDQGTEHFQPSHLEITSIDTDNPTVNVIPARSEVKFGVRFNPLQNSLKLSEMIEEICTQSAGQHTLQLRWSGDPFLTEDSGWIQCVHQALYHASGQHPTHTTQGGTTDGRFLCKMAPVVEVGLPETTIHQVDEHVEISEIETLETIYRSILLSYFKGQHKEAQGNI
jgi:succinyl-diaminopimelate desuccinylase